MRAVWIDFKQSSPLHIRVLRTVLLVFGLLALGFSLMLQQQVRAEKNSLLWKVQNLTRLEARRLPQLHAATDSALAQDAAKHANAVLRQLNRPWDPLFSALEHSVAPNASVLSVSPDPQKSAITIKALAQDTGAAIDFMERLQSTGLLSGVHLVNQELSEDEKRLPLMFTLSAKWEALP